MKAIWRAAEGKWNYGKIVRVLMLTGLRRDEIGSLARDEINSTSEQIVIDAIRTKNGRPHSTPITAPMWKVLDGHSAEADDPRRSLVFSGSDNGFSGWSRQASAR